MTLSLDDENPLNQGGLEINLTMGIDARFTSLVLRTDLSFQKRLSGVGSNKTSGLLSLSISSGIPPTFYIVGFVNYFTETG